MAYIYPYAGHNSNTVTTNNDDNQPITPHSSHLWVSSTQPNQIATSALKTAGKSHFISFFSLRKTGAVVLLLIMTMGATAWGQGITWDGQHIGKYYSMCSNTPRNGPNNNNITNCTQCSVTQTITMSSDQDANGNMWFKAPAGCTLTITLSSYTFRSGGNPTNYDRLYIYYDDGPITNNWNNYTAVRDWYNGHVAQNGNGTDRNTYTSTTTGGWISLRYQNNRTGDQNNRRSSFTVTIECNCSSSSGCSNATSLPCGTTDLAGTTEGAPNIPHGIPGADASNRGAWYTFTGDGSETTITTTSASFDNCIVVASGSCNNLTLVAEIDGSYGDESYSFQTTNGDTYYVYIAYYESGNTTGTFTISRTCTTAPTNSTCASATNLPCGTSNLAGTTVGTPGTAHGIPGANVSNYGVWYTFVGDGNVTTITSTAAYGFDHEMDICSGSCNNLTLIADLDAGYDGGTESYTFQTTNGVTYYVYIAHYGSGNTTTGAFTISRTCTTPPANSTCASATNLPCGTSNLEGTTVGTPGTAHGIPGAYPSNYGVWYTFVGDGNATTITTSSGSFDNCIVVAKGSCNNLSLVQYVDLYGSGAEDENYSFLTEDGVTYYVYIAYYDSYYTTTGDFTISRTCVEIDCSSQCEISYELADSFGDGWNGCAILVEDVTSGFTLEEWSIDNGDNASGTLSVCNGHTIQFSWVSGSYPGECSYTITSEEGAVIVSGNGAISSPVTHIPNCCEPRTGDFEFCTSSVNVTTSTPDFSVQLTNTLAPAGTVTYTNSNSSVATFDGSTGTVHPVANGSTTITATVAADDPDGYCEYTTSFRVNVGTAGGGGGEDCNTIGNESGEAYSAGLGLESYWKYTWAEMIYTAAEMGVSSDGCTITSIAFKVDGYYSDMDEPQTTTIYMGMTTKSQFDNDEDFVSPAGGAMQNSYSGTWTLHDGWNTFTLNTPFEYTDHTKNLIIGMLCITQDDYSSDYIYYTESTNRFICGYSDDYQPNPTNMASFITNVDYSGDGYHERSDYRPDMKICFECGFTPTAIPSVGDIGNQSVCKDNAISNISVSASDYNSLTLSPPDKGLSISGTTISGTPNFTGSQTFTVTAADAENCLKSKKTFTVNVNQLEAIIEFGD